MAEPEAKTITEEQERLAENRIRVARAANNARTRERKRIIDRIDLLIIGAKEPESVELLSVLAVFILDGPENYI